MSAKQQTPQGQEQSEISSFITQMPVFPPLPPLPPPDTCTSSKTMRKATSASVDPRPRLFGVKTTNLLEVRDVSPNTQRIDYKSPRSLAMAAAQRYYHQYQYLSHSGKKAQSAKEGGMGEKEHSPSVRGDTISTTQDCSGKSPMQPGRTIWSVTPEELAELAKEMAAAKMNSSELGRKLTYAEASKRNISGSTDNQVAQKIEMFEENQPPRVFKKYYGLPNLPFYDPSSSMNIADTSEENDPSEELAGSFSKKVSTAPTYSQLLRVSSDTPTFYPRQTGTNDVIRVVRSIILHAKVYQDNSILTESVTYIQEGRSTHGLVAGNYVFSHFVPRKMLKCVRLANRETGNAQTAAITYCFLSAINFSYRDSCKRCRVGRLEDAGFVFPSSSTSTESSI
ncbi:hypothetical protein P3T76_015682 [Phytophthora citrophthora]|uniref:Uncharacterized protein n=1 Tax=Phytophthora citrophthora TaxID=4793 RepID=A0AAD9FZ07_9STRA|nr:hypothetical protein P3T76_015682 [Phytophthora citrophthora]